MICYAYFLWYLCLTLSKILKTEPNALQFYNHAVYLSTVLTIYVMFALGKNKDK